MGFSDARISLNPSELVISPANTATTYDELVRDSQIMPAVEIMKDGESTPSTTVYLHIIW